MYPRDHHERGAKSKKSGRGVNAVSLGSWRKDGRDRRCRLGKVPIGSPHKTSKMVGAESGVTDSIALLSLSSCFGA